MKVSECCGASKSNGDSCSEDYGICPICGEHCEYVEDEEEERYESMGRWILNKRKHEENTP
jgi:hypothetical protein